MINTICAVALLSTYFSYTNVNEFVEKITYDNRHFIQVSSPYNNSYFKSNSSSNLKVGNETHFFPYGGSFSREYIAFLKVYLPSYDPTNPFYHNCYYYAINYYPDFPTTTAINYWNGEQYSIQFMEENVIPNFINKTLQLYSILLRPIDSYDSYVYNWEYRIAFRLKINLGTIDDYHFMRQSNTGSWCDKMMATCSSEHTNFNPTTDNWPYGFDSPTYYFAVSTL